VQLEQSPFLDLVSENKVNQTLKLMGRPAGDRLTPEVAREVCQRTGSKAMVTGSKQSQLPSENLRLTLGGTDTFP
jgi:eukaryotic-like serine/threonine-protein kinase